MNSTPTPTDFNWTPLRLTYAVYPKGDIFGYFLAYVSLFPVAVMVGLATLILFRRDLHTICLFAGLVANEAFNWVLKHTIRESRPGHGPLGHQLTYGMPSSHAQFIWCFAIYMKLFAFVRLLPPQRLCGVLERLLLFVGLSLLTLLVSYGRIYLEHHTPAQVLVGAAIGVLYGVVLFAVIHFLLSPYFPEVIEWRVARLLLLRDSTHIPDLLFFEYNVVYKHFPTNNHNYKQTGSQTANGTIGGDAGDFKKSN